MATKQTTKSSGPTGSSPGRYANVANATPPGPEAWHFDSEMMGEAVRSILAGGDAVMVSTTRDGGALRLIVFEGQDKHTFYASGDGEIGPLLSSLVTNLG
jgi:hypothetical protein